MRRRAQNAPTIEVTKGDEQSYQGEVPPNPLHRRRGKGRPKVVAAQEVEQEHPLVEQEAHEVNQKAFVVGMVGIKAFQL